MSGVKSYYLSRAEIDALIAGLPEAPPWVGDSTDPLWWEEPASERQRRYIRALGGDPERVYNKDEASALITRLKRQAGKELDAVAGKESAA